MEFSHCHYSETTGCRSEHIDRHRIDISSPDTDRAVATEQPASICRLSTSEFCNPLLLHRDTALVAVDDDDNNSDHAAGSGEFNGDGDEVRWLGTVAFYDRQSQARSPAMVSCAVLQNILYRSIGKKMPVVQSSNRSLRQTYG